MGLFLQRYISLWSPLSLNPLKLDKRESIHFYNHFVEVDTQEIVIFGSKGWLMYSPTHRALTFLSLCCSCHLLKLDGFPSQVCPQEHLEHPFPAPSPPCRGTIQWCYPGCYGGHHLWLPPHLSRECWQSRTSKKKDVKLLWFLLSGVNTSHGYALLLLLPPLQFSGRNSCFAL